MDEWNIGWIGGWMGVWMSGQVCRLMDGECVGSRYMGGMISITVIMQLSVIENGTKCLLCKKGMSDWVRVSVKKHVTHDAVRVKGTMWLSGYEGPCCLQSKMDHVAVRLKVTMLLLANM